MAAASTDDLPRRLYLVRHGLPAIDPRVPPHEWRLDPAGVPDIDRLRSSGRLPAEAVWYSSPEPKALATARRLTDCEVLVRDALREHERGPTSWFDDRSEWEGLVRRAFAEPARPVLSGWEPLAATRDRVVPAVRMILAEHPDEEIALTGHGTTWTLLAAELTGSEPDLEAWARLEMPDLWVLTL